MRANLVKDTNRHSSLVRFWRDRRGATAIEYALVAALVSVAIVVSLMLLGGSLDELYTAFGTVPALNQ